MFTGFFHLYLFTMWELFGRLYNRWGHLCVECEPSDLCYVHTTWSGIQHMWTSLEPKWQWWDCLLWCDGSTGHHRRLHTACFWRQQYVCKSVLASSLYSLFSARALARIICIARCEVLKPLLVNIEVFYVILPYQLANNQWCFGGAGQSVFLMPEPEDGDDIQSWNTSDYLLTWRNFHKHQNLPCLSHVILITQMHNNSSNQTSPLIKFIGFIFCFEELLTTLLSWCVNTVPAYNDNWKSHIVLHESMKK